MLNEAHASFIITVTSASAPQICNITASLFVSQVSTKQHITDSDLRNNLCNNKFWALSYCPTRVNFREQSWIYGQ